MIEANLRQCFGDRSSAFEKVRNQQVRDRVRSSTEKTQCGKRVTLFAQALGKLDLKLRLDSRFDQIPSNLSSDGKVKATNSGPTDELIEGVARNMRRTLYVLWLVLDFVGHLASRTNQTSLITQRRKQAAI